MAYTMQEYNAYFTEEVLREVAHAITDLSDEELHFRLHDTSNSIAWDAWHIFRTTDNIVHFVFDREDPVWLKQRLDQRWNLPRVQQGTGMPPEEAWALRFPPAQELAQYGLEVKEVVVPRIRNMSDEYGQVVTLVKPWGEITRFQALGEGMVSHANKHLGYIAAAMGVLGKQGPSF